MWNRGIFIGVFLCFLLLGSSAFAMPPVHRDFLDAENDFFSLLSFFEDTRILCENMLSSSYQANATLFFNDTIIIHYDIGNKNQSLELSVQLLNKINYSANILDDINHQFSSYSYLANALIPLKNLGGLSINISEIHGNLLDTFSNIVVASNQSNYDTTIILSNLTLAYEYITSLRNDIITLEALLPTISTYFEIDTLQQLSIEFSTLLERYELYINQYIILFPLVDPMIVLFTDKSDYYLGDTILFTGYVIGEQGYVPNQDVHVFFDDVSIFSQKTNDNGRFNGSYRIQPSMKPTYHRLYAETTYLETLYISQQVEILIKLIPTSLFIQVSQADFAPLEPIHITGILMTFDSKPIQDTIEISLASDIYEVATDSTGRVSFDIINDLPYGSYVIKGHYTPTMLYDPCISEEQYFRINEPTQLSILVNNQNITRGETLTLRGVLHSSDTKEPLIDKPITLKINGLNVQTSTTNDEGEYIFSLSTKNISSHSISIQTIYTSPDIKWRNAASPLVKISFYADYVQYFNSLAWLLLIFIFASVILSAFYLNKRRRTLENKTGSTSLSSPKQSPDTSILETIPSFLLEKTFSDEKGLAQGNPISLKDKIIATYHTFLGYLSQRGIPIKKTDSHRDIQQRLYSTKLPKDTVDMVTIGFEIARYSPYPVLQEDADAFDRQVFSMMTSFKEDVKEQ